MTDWAPLADRDPIPGDPNGVAGLARRLSADADSMRTQLQRLEAVNSDEFWCGQAAEEFRKHQKELPDLLNHVVTRFEHVSAALSSYVPGLGEAQSQSRAALARAKEAQADIDSAKAGIEQLNRQAEEAKKTADDWGKTHPGDPPPPSQTWASPNYNARLDQAEAELEAARRMLADAKQIRDDAAHRCADTIGDASHDDLKNDTGLFHRIGHAVTHFVEQAAPIVAVAAAVLGVASLVFPVLAPLAIGVGAVALLCDTWAALDTGKGWGVVAMDAFALATFGVGRALEAAAKGAQVVGEAEKGAQVLEATKGVKGALKGFSVVTEDGTKLTGAAARSAKLKELGTTVAEYESRGGRNWLPSVKNLRSAFSPSELGSDFKNSFKALAKSPGKALTGSFKETRELAGLSREAREGVTDIGKHAWSMKRIDLGVEASGAGVGSSVGYKASHELFGGHEGEGGHDAPGLELTQRR